MASKDFRASQVLTSRLIMSGVAGTNNLGLVVYSGSISTDQIGNVSDGNLFSNVGDDVTVFFSGSDGAKYGNTGGAVLFGGDVVVSGTLYAERQVIEVDESVTGSLLVSGSMIVSQSATIKEGLSVNTSLESGSENSFTVFNAAGGKSIFSDSTSKQVFILSGTNSSPASDNESSYTDVNFFVSGAIGSKDSSHKGTSLFGGDLHVSGNLTVDGSSPGGGGGNTLDQAYDQGGSGAGAVITVDQQPVQLAASSGGQALAVTGSAIFGDRSSQFSNHLPPMPGPDTIFFFSGTIGGKDAAAPTVTTFGGDVVISGALHGGSPLQVGGYNSNLGTDVGFFVNGSPAASKNDPANNALIGGGLVVSGGAYFNSTISDMTGQQNIDLTSTDYMAFNVDGTNTWLEIDATLAQPVISVNPYSENYDFLVGGDSPGFSSYQAIFVDASENAVILASKQTSTALPGNDVNLFVSGTIGAKGGSSRAISVFGGDVVSSGSIYATEFYGDIQGAIRFSAINDEGDAISKGQVVYIKGIQGQTPTVALAACDDPNKMPAFGLAATNAANGAAVEIVTAGDLSNFNINTLYGGIFSEGDVLYVATGSNHTSGSLTNIRPTGGENLLQNMGFVVRDGGGGDSRVKVGGAGRSNATPNLNDGQIFIGDSTNCSTTASLGLNLAYASGSGAIIGVDGQPVQLQAGSSTALAVTGSALFGFASTEFSNGLPPVASDTPFFVSGAIGGKGTTGTAVFGGDLHISGNLTVDGSSPGGGGGNTLDQAYDQGGAGAGAIITADSGPVQIQNPSSTGLAITGSSGVEPRIKLIDSGTPANYFSDIFVNNDGDLNITTGNGTGARNHIILNPRSGGTGNVILGQAGAVSTLTFQGNTVVNPTSAPFIRANTSSPVEFRMHNASQNGKVVIQASTYPLGSGPGPVVINEDGGACDFRVESDLRQGAILVDGGTEQVALLTDGTTAADAYGLNASTSAIPSDIALYVSGAAYDLSSGIFDTSNTGGKSATFGGDLVVSGAIIGGNSSLSGITGEASPLILTALNGSSIYHGAGTHGFYGDVSALQNPGDDAFFFVSGTIGGKNTEGVAILGGDTVVSGSLYVMTGSNQGIILQAPNGGKYFLTVDNAGNLSTSTA